MPISTGVGLTKCSSCKIEHQKIDDGRFNSGRRRYRDERGYLWVNGLCRECSVLYIKNRRRRLGISNSYDNCNAPNLRKGRLSEVKVKEFFESLGNIVKLTDFHGPDLIINTGRQRLTCEVKSVVRAYKNRLLVDKIGKLQVYNDYVAYVYGDQIHITTMKDHLAACPPSGQRTVTKLFNVTNSKPISRAV